ncbi:MAG: hypothetical protein EXR77_15040 [Myxococcales bacterium]|nr:hypothetical protein [Myxococcales bacterium]
MRRNLGGLEIIDGTLGVNQLDRRGQHADGVSRLSHVNAHRCQCKQKIASETTTIQGIDIEFFLKHRHRSLGEIGHTLALPRGPRQFSGIGQDSPRRQIASKHQPLSDRQPLSPAGLRRCILTEDTQNGR